MPQTNCVSAVLPPPVRTHQFLDDVLRGLQSPRKSLPCKYFYDERGSRLFDEICRLEEYYPTRTELAIMRRHAGEMAEACAPRCRLVEYGSGSSLKTRLLLDRLEAPAAYVPVDISGNHLQATVAGLTRRYPSVCIQPLAADFTRSFALPPTGSCDRTVVYFPGSTIGNFTPGESVRLLTSIAELCGEGGGLLIGVDLKKSRAVLEAAYNDSRGLTRAFNLNLLARLNRELGADFRIDQFEHRAVYDETQGRIEMHLVSRVAQEVHLGGATVRFAAEETIHTENSYKYTHSEFESIAVEAGFRVQSVWVDDGCDFSVQYHTF